MAGLATATAVGSSLLGWSLFERSRSGQGSRFPAAARSGVILAWNEDGALLESRPDGRHTSRLHGLGRFRLRGLPAISPGGGLVAFDDGQVVDTSTAPPVLLKDRLDLGPDQVLPARNAFSAGGSDVVTLTEGRGGNPTTTAGISVVNLRTGASTTLGAGDLAAGDPQRPGAFVAVASPSPAGGGGANPATPNSELELLDTDRPPLVLASAAALEGELGLAPSTPVSLLPAPSPSGALVAVTVEDVLEPLGSNAGLVVLDRRGRVVSAQEPGRGPTSVASPVWSPDGTALAYVNEGRSRNAISIWTIGAGVVTATLPAGVGAGQCLWSPTGAAVLCDSSSSLHGRIHETWSVTTPRGGPVASLPGPGFAVDWFGASK